MTDIFKNQSNDFEPLTNIGLPPKGVSFVKLPEPALFVDSVNDQLFVTTKNMMFRLDKTEAGFNPVRIL